MSDKLPMSREQIAEEVAKCFPLWENITIDGRDNILATFEHVLRIGTTELREENKRLRSGEFICNRCGLRKDSDNFFGEIPF